MASSEGLTVQVVIFDRDKQHWDQLDVDVTVYQAQSKSLPRNSYCKVVGMALHLRALKVPGIHRAASVKVGSMRPTLSGSHGEIA